MKLFRVALALVLAFSLTGCVVAIGNKGNEDVGERLDRIEQHLGLEPLEAESSE